MVRALDFIPNEVAVGRILRREVILYNLHYKMDFPRYFVENDFFLT
jgi:hypothetical protein